MDQRLKEITKEINILKIERGVIRARGLKTPEHKLITEAKEKGFHLNMVNDFRCLMKGDYPQSDKSIFVVNEKLQVVTLGGNIIYDNGNWAKILN